MIDAAELGRLLSMPPKAVLRLGREGRIPRHVISRKTIRFVLSEVREYLKQNGKKDA